MEGAYATTARRGGSATGMPQRVAVLINGGAGTAQRTDGAALNLELASAFADAGIDAQIDRLESANLREAALSALASARSGSIDAVVAGGGDGTIRTVAGVLAGTEVPLGVLPLGTLNHFARDLGIPLELRDAVAVIAGGRTSPVDLGEVNREIFINNSSLGIYPYVVSDRERRQSEDGHAKWTAMVLAVFRAFHRFPLRRLTLSAGGAVTTYRTPCLFVGNNEYDTDLLSLGRRHRLDEGELDFYVARSARKWSFVWFVLRAIFGNTARMPDLDHFTASEATIDSRASRLTVALDGEVTTLPTPLHYRARPGALTVFVPDDDSAAQRPQS